MKDFFKYVMATVVGFLLSQIVLLLLFFVMIASMIAVSGIERSRGERVESNSILHITLDQPIEEMRSHDFTVMLSSDKPMVLREVLSSIRRAKDDNNIQGILLETGFTNASFTNLDEIQRALIDFKESGKFVYAYADYLTNRGMFLYSVADSIFINPVGMVTFAGFHSEIPFFRGTLDKLEIEPRIVKVGDYKSAGEMFTHKQLSPENREQVEAIVFDSYDYFLNVISEHRRIPAEELRRIADGLLASYPEEAVQHRLVDGIRYKDEVLANMKERAGIDQDQKLKMVKLGDYVSSGDKKRGRGGDIALIYAVGEIVMGEGGRNQMGGEATARLIRQARLDDNIKAIVLRVNSPGGSALASDVILREMMLSRQVKPVIVSMGDVAASGGYYIACHADTIVAQHSTVTGSIGVIGFVPMLRNFWENKLGITWDRVSTGQYSDIGNPNRPFTGDEERIIQRMLDTIYTDFINHVATGRNLSPEFVHSIGQGRVWTGRQALEHGLIDVLGGLDTAIAIAARRADISDPRLKILPEPKSPFDQLLRNLSMSATERIMKNQLGEDYQLFQEMKRIREYSGPMAIMPFRIEIK